MVVAALALAIFVIAATGIAAAVSYDADGGERSASLERFCRRYKALLEMDPPKPPFSQAPEGDAQAAANAMEDVIALGVTSGNQDVERAFAKVEASMAAPFDATGSNAESAATAYVDSYRTSVKECAAIQIDVVPRRP